MITRRHLIQVAVSVIVARKTTAAQAPSAPTGMTIELDAVEHWAQIATFHDDGGNKSTATVRVRRGMLRCGQRVLIRCAHSEHQIIFTGVVVRINADMRVANGADVVDLEDFPTWNARRAAACHA